jgi:hypothetical protein
MGGAEGGSVSVLEIAEDLYGLPLPEFTPARDGKAKELKGEPEAATVKALRKPSTAAWVVNLLVRFETEQVDQMLQVGAALRAAQADLDATQLRALTVQRRQLTAAVTVRARALARERGVRVTESVADLVEQTLTAAMIDEGAAAAVRSGLLVTTLVATGFSAVDVASAVAVPEAVGHVAQPASREMHVVPSARGAAAAQDDGDDRQAERRAAGEAAVRDAQAAAKAARRQRDDAARRVKKQQARSLQAQAELDELRRRVADAEDAAQRADDDLSAAEEAVVQAESDLAGAEEAVGDAEEALAGLET